MRGGMPKGYERLASTHRERVECAVVAVGSVVWRETGKLSPSGDLRCWAGTTGSGWAFSRGRCLGIFAKQLFLPPLGLPAVHTPLPRPVASALALSGLLLL